MEDSGLRHAGLWQYIIVCMIAFIDGADLAVMGACFRAFEQDLHLGPVLLGLMSFAQKLTESVAAPVWGWLCDESIASRKLLWMGGTAGWAFVMGALALASSMSAVIALRLLNGCFLACLAPLLQSWVAEHVAPGESGRIFGFIHTATTLGAGTSGFLAVRVLKGKFQLQGLGEVGGWRILCCLISLLALGVTALVWRCFDADRAKDDLAKAKLREGRARPTTFVVDLQQNVRDHWESHTFRIIVLQGILGGTAFAAANFEMMFYEYLGMSPSQMALLISVPAIPSLIGGTTGGLFGDFMERHFPQHGRAYTAQICVTGIIICVLPRFLVFPWAFGVVVAPYAASRCLLPVIGGMYHPGVLKPLLIEVADPARRASIIGWQHALEGTCAAFLGAPLVGWLSEHVFGYRPTSLSISAMPQELRTQNMSALRWSLAVMMLVPLSICLIINSDLHRAYPRDKRVWAEARNRREARSSEELQTVLGKQGEAWEKSAGRAEGEVELADERK